MITTDWLAYPLFRWAYEFSPPSNTWL